VDDLVKQLRSKSNQAESKEDIQYRQKLDKSITLAAEGRFTDVLNTVFFFSLPEIIAVHVQKDHLCLTVHVPFFLPPPSAANSAWLSTRPSQTKLKRGFARHLRGPEFSESLSHLIYVELSKFLLELGNIGRYSESTQKYLRRIAQRRLAGRHAHPVPKRLLPEVKKKGLEIHRVVREMQRTVMTWKTTVPGIDGQEIEKRIRREYPVKSHTWMPYFFTLIPKLPRKPYAVRIDETAADVTGKLPPAKLSEPNRWSTIDITVKILQAKLLADKSALFALRSIERALTQTRHQGRN